MIKKRRIPYQQGEAHMLNSQRFKAMSRQKISPSKAEDKPSQKVTSDLTLELGNKNCCLIILMKKYVLILWFH